MKNKFYFIILFSGLLSVPAIAKMESFKYQWRGEIFVLYPAFHRARITNICYRFNSPHTNANNIGVARLINLHYSINANIMEIWQNAMGEKKQSPAIHIYFRKIYGDTGYRWLEIPPFPKHKVLSGWEGNSCTFGLSNFSINYFHATPVFSPDFYLPKQNTSQ